MTGKIRLGAFLPGGGQHVAAAWRHPDEPSDGAISFASHLEFAREAERGLVDAYFLADGLAVSFGGGSEGGDAKCGLRAGDPLRGAGAAHHAPGLHRHRLDDL